jgi:ribose transport system substrate-binding protein
MRKRGAIGVGAVAISALLATAACGSSSGSGKTASDAGKKSYNIIMIPGVSGNEGYDSVVCGAKQIADAKHVKLSVQDANTFSPTAQTPILEAAVAKHPDAILIAPTDAKAMEGPIQQAVNQGIKVVLFDANLSSPSGSSAWVGVNNTVGGQLAGTTMSKLLGGKGQVMLTNFNRGTSTTDAREDGFVAQLKKSPGIQYLGPQYNNNDSQAAAASVSAEITAHPQLAGVYGTAQGEVEGIIAGVRNSGKTGKITVVGFDAAPPEVAAVKQGSVQALVAQDVHDEGTTAMNVALDVLAGKKVKSTYYVGFYAITKDNVNTAASQAHYYTASCKY